jgi:hypothetical protein
VLLLLLLLMALVAGCTAGALLQAATSSNSEERALLSSTTLVGAELGILLGEELPATYPPECPLTCRHTRNQGGYWRGAAAVRPMRVGESAAAAPLQ